MCLVIIIVCYRLEKQILEIELTYQEQRTRLVSEMRAENERVAAELSTKENQQREQFGKFINIFILTLFYVTYKVFGLHGTTIQNLFVFRVLYLKKKKRIGSLCCLSVFLLRHLFSGTRRVNLKFIKDTVVYCLLEI